MSIPDFKYLVDLCLNERNKPFLCGADEEEIVIRCYNNGSTVAECVDALEQHRTLERN